MTVVFWSSDSSPSLTTILLEVGQSSLSVSDSKLEMPSFLADLCRTGESARSEGFGRSVWSLLVGLCLVAEDSVPVHSDDVDPGRCRSDWSWMVD